MKKQLTVGILAHVDAGKTTLSESILYETGKIRKLGRVDHKDAFLDTYELEKSRGITIFSKQARFELEEAAVTLLDTPGHVDFSSEMERTLQVLDYAVLVINGMDGVQSHTETVWRLLARYHIPTFIFVNKMDQRGTDRFGLLAGLQKRLSKECIPFDEELFSEEWQEEIACQDEALLEKYMEGGEITDEEVARLIWERKVFPCYFGSALKLNGVDIFLEGLNRFTKSDNYPEEFGARVFKITRDAQGNRLTHLKVTGGNLPVKTLIDGEKVNQIRLYNGVKYDTADLVLSGGVCAVTGLNETYAGQGLGIEENNAEVYLEPVMEYQLILPEGCDIHKTFGMLRQLEEEDPQLHLVWKEEIQEIHVKLMGEIQTEILKSLIKERFSLDVSFGCGSIVYKETIDGVVEGVGHFEPLKHYAEVHLLLEPNERGCGMEFSTQCSQDMLDLNWQRLIMTHLAEREHKGVLAGFGITDVKITILSGRAHVKHTEGGDFREATYRAVRQGLKQANTILLEPYYSFRLEVPQNLVGRAMSDIQRKNGTFTLEDGEEMAVLTGSAPVACMQGYLSEVNAYTQGRGRLSLSLKGYEECHNTEEVVTQTGYDSEADTDNPTGSVFCSHGAGHYVTWDEVFKYMHLESWLKKGQRLVASTDSEALSLQAVAAGQSKSKSDMYGSWESDKELEAIFEKTFGATSGKRGVAQGDFGYEKKRFDEEKAKRIEEAAKEYHETHKKGSVKRKQEKYVLVDGYNVIFAWDELKELTHISLDAARGRLMDILCNYQGYSGCTMIVVFDTYKVKGNPGSVVKYHNIYVVYTKEAETADMYIEKATKEIGHKEHVTVVTSDGLEQLIVAGHGAVRMSAGEFLRETERIGSQEV